MRIRISDLSLYFDVEGAQLESRGSVLSQKQTIVLLHGGPGFDHAQLKPEFSELADLAQVVYLDLRGHGRSDRGSPATWTLARWGEDVFEFCQALGIEKPIVYGVSFGGFVAQAYAIRHPAHPSALILSSTAARLCVERITEAFARLGDAQTSEIARRFWLGEWNLMKDNYVQHCLPLYNRKPGDPTRIERQIFSPDPAAHFVGPTGEVRRFNFLKALTEIACPVLVIAGELDPVTTIEDSEELVAALPRDRTTFVRVPNCGHVVLWEQPHVEIEAIRTFVQNHRAVSESETR